LFEKIVSLVFENNLLNEDGILVLEHSKQTDFKNHPRLSYQKKYGGNMFSFFENQPADLE
jgi:16S rRNA (guanine966-N2)-methyltransferase